jgi:nitrite reductase/ring-hydroxylating ferredoxin subunit
MPEVRVPGAVRLEEGKTQVFLVSGGKHAKNGFVIRYQGQLLAFLNECPHWSVDLDLGDEDFFDEELERIYCKNHGALFVLPSGECETGPCLGRALTAYALRVEGEDALVSV